ncbi:hypothetical protein DFS34DRAFT_115832 [Phlyctochytrium arcticum]|nr:hypothetical protein DFS34DRAFT_115832 [Phlyctochytrium arcticum]
MSESKEDIATPETFSGLAEPKKDQGRHLHFNTGNKLEVGMKDHIYATSEAKDFESNGLSTPQLSRAISKFSTFSSNAQNGVALESQGKLSSTMRGLWLYLWLLGTFFTAFLLVVDERQITLPIDADHGEWVAVTLAELPVLLYCTVLNRLMDFCIVAWSRRMFATGTGSLAIIGYLNASAISRPMFLSSLSFRSKLRRTLTPVAYVQLIMIFLPILAIIGSTGTRLSTTTIHTKSNCFVIDRSGFTREQPLDVSYDYVNGVADYFTSKGMGQMRADGFDQTIAVLGPETDTNAQWFRVRGFATCTLMRTTCHCGSGSRAAWKDLYKDAGITEYEEPPNRPNVNTEGTGGIYIATTIATLAAVSNSTNKNSGLLNQELYDGDICGGKSSRLMCTTFSTLRKGIATVEYAASVGGVAPSAVLVSDIEVSDEPFVAGSTTWKLLLSWFNLFNTTQPLSRFRMSRPPPLLQWLSQTGSGLSALMAEEGMEMFNVLLVTQALSISQNYAVETCDVTERGSGSFLTLSSFPRTILFVLGGVTLVLGITAYVVARYDDQLLCKLPLNQNLSETGSIFLETLPPPTCGMHWTRMWHSVRRSAQLKVMSDTCQSDPKSQSVRWRWGGATYNRIGREKNIISFVEKYLADCCSLEMYEIVFNAKCVLGILFYATLEVIL